MSYTILAARYANAEASAVDVDTAEAGTVLVDLAPIPLPPGRAGLEAWLAAGNTPSGYVPPPAPIGPPIQRSLIVTRILDLAGGAAKLAAVCAVRDADLVAREWWSSLHEGISRDPAETGHVLVRQILTAGGLSPAEIDQVLA